MRESHISSHRYMIPVSADVPAPIQAKLPPLARLSGLITLLASIGLATSLAVADDAAARVDDAQDIRCMENGYLSSYLHRAYGEDQIASGESDDGHPIQLYASRRGSWTLVELMPDGNGCVNAAGKRLKINNIPKPKAKPAS